MTRVYGHSSHGKSTSPNVTNGDHRNNGHEHDDADLDAGRFLLKEKAKLPTADVLKTAIDEDEDPARIAAGFVLALGKACGNGEAFADLFWEDGERLLAPFCGDAEGEQGSGGIGSCLRWTIGLSSGSGEYVPLQRYAHLVLLHLQLELSLNRLAFTDSGPAISDQTSRFYSHHPSSQAEQHARRPQLHPSQSLVRHDHRHRHCCGQPHQNCARLEGVDDEHDDGESLRLSRAACAARWTDGGARLAGDKGSRAGV